MQQSRYSRSRFAFLAAVGMALAAGLSGCSSDKVSSQTLEDARTASFNNSTLVAVDYVRKSPRLVGMEIVGHADEHQTATCPQGSGWAYPSALRNTRDAEGKIIAVEKVKLVCSTVSTAIGCYREQDFKETAHAAQAGRCDKELSYPLPKLVGKG